MKKTLLILVVILLAVGTPVFATTKTTSLSFATGGNFYTNFNYFGRLMTSGVSLRTVTCKDEIGFYSGFNVSLTTATALAELQLSPFATNFAFASGFGGLFLDLSVPFGNRWAGGKSGFFIGGGPEVLTAYTGGILVRAGVFGELGWQTNKTSGIGFHFAWKVGYLPVMYSSGGGFGFQFTPYFWPSLEIGISWRKITS